MKKNFTQLGKLLLVLAIILFSWQTSWGQANAYAKITEVTPTYDKTAKSVTITWYSDINFTSLMVPQLVLNTDYTVTINGDNINVSTTKPTITIGIVDNLAYTLNGTEPTTPILDIQPFPITVTADPNQEKGLGALEPILTFTSTALFTPDDFSGALSRVPGESIGSYPITIGSLDVGSNYTITFLSNNFEIKQIVSTNTSASNITSSSADISGNAAGAEAYSLRYNEYGSSYYFYLTKTNSSFKLENLIQNKRYLCNISSKVNGQWSARTPSADFTTLSGAQLVASDVIATPLTSSATISWTGSGAQLYSVRYYLTGSTSYNYITSTTSPVTLINLIPGKSYSCDISSQITGAWSFRTAPIGFTTASGSQLVASDLVATPVSPSSESISWTGAGAQLYSIRYYVTGSTDFNYVTTTASTITLTNLLPSKSYSCDISSQISGAWSIRTTPVVFTTAAGAQLVASDLVATPVSPSSESISWTGSGAQSYSLRYYLTGSTNYTYVTSTTSPVTLINFLPNTSYSCDISSQISGVWSVRTAPVVFTTAVGAQLVASDLVAISVSPNSESISWTGSGADAYSLRYYTTGSTNYNYITTTTSPITLTNFLPNTSYSCDISSQISGVWSVRTAAVVFTTAAGTSLAASNLVATSISPNSESISWTGSGADAYSLRYYTTGSTNYNYVTSTSSPVTLVNFLPNTSYSCDISSQISGVWSVRTAAVVFTTAAGTSLAASSLVATSISPNSESISWTGSGADAYSLRYYTTGSTNYNYVTSTTSLVTISSFLPNTSYSCDISSKISGVWSVRTAPVVFTTAPGAQLVASDLIATSVSPNSESISWTGAGADLYSLRYYLTGSTNYTYVTSTTAPVTLLNLLPNTSYSCDISSQISGVWTVRTLPIVFNTASALLGASNLIASAGPTSAYISWSGTANSYSVRYYKTGSTNMYDFYYIVTTSLWVNLTDLLPNTSYSCDIASNLYGYWSDRTEPVIFTTPALTKSTNAVLGVSNNNINNEVSISNVQLYPNPATSYVNLNISSPKAGEYFIKIYSMDGKVVIDKGIELTEGLNTQIIDINSIDNGFYILQLIGNNERKQIKFLKK